MVKVTHTVVKVAHTVVKVTHTVVKVTDCLYSSDFKLFTVLNYRHVYSESILLHVFYFMYFDQ